MSLFNRDRVLVPLDFSDEAFAAIAESLEFVEDPARLHVLHVLQKLEITEPGMVWNTLDIQTRTQNVKTAFYRRCNTPAYQQIHFHVAIGDAAAEIIDYAQKQAISLIVIPSQGRTGLSRFLLGSVAERVVRFAHCPVLVLRK
ncbi:universal stress protein [Trichothermofontia sp.]